MCNDITTHPRFAMYSSEISTYLMLSDLPWSPWQHWQHPFPLFKVQPSSSAWWALINLPLAWSPSTLVYPWWAEQFVGLVRHVWSIWMDAVYQERWPGRETLSEWLVRKGYRKRSMNVISLSVELTSLVVWGSKDKDIKRCRSGQTLAQST